MKLRMIIYFSAAILAAFLILFATETSSSAARGTLHGIVTDPSGAVIAGATVEVSGNHSVQTVYTDATGQYAVAGLAPAHYKVEILANGFSPADKSGLVVSAGCESEADGQLAVRPLSQQITVSAGL